MAENSLQNAGREVATADRYQVIPSVDASELEQADETAVPTRNAFIQRVACWWPHLKIIIRII